jgi:putative DNA primase/helicase
MLKIVKPYLECSPQDYDAEVLECFQRKVPQELIGKPRWACWQMARDTKKKKVFINPRTGHNASCHDPNSVSDIATAYRYCCDVLRDQGKPCGVCFRLAGDGLIGIDLDHCYSRHSDEIAACAKYIIQKLDTYTEFSQSRKGFHLIVRGKLTPDHRYTKELVYRGVKGMVRIVNQNRFFVLTGDKLPFQAPHDKFTDRTEALWCLYRWLFDLEGDGDIEA